MIVFRAVGVELRQDALGLGDAFSGERAALGVEPWMGEEIEVAPAARLPHWPMPLGDSEVGA
jgi:hypothetical protein